MQEIYTSNCILLVLAQFLIQLHSSVYNYENTLNANIFFSLQYFFRLCVVTVTVPLPHRYRFWPAFINVTDRYLNVTQSYSMWPEPYPPLLNVTWTLPTVTQRDLNVTSTWPQLDLNLTSTWPQRDLNVCSWWPQCYLTWH